MLDQHDRSTQARLCDAFLQQVTDRIEGWLDRFTAKRTFDLLAAQERFGVAGALYEVGLYYGKYFSLLVHAGVRAQSRIVGLDTFDYVPQPTFLAGFLTTVAPTVLGRDGTLDDLRTGLMAARSTDVSAAALRTHFGGGDARFISIDGSHEFDDVLWDLAVARELLAPGGIIAVDDYLHPICLGVTAAADRFLANHFDLVPFAYIANKLFLSRPAWADRYRDETEAAILHDDADAKGRAFKIQAESGPAARRNIEAIYAGYRVLTVAL